MTDDLSSFLQSHDVKIIPTRVMSQKGVDIFEKLKNLSKLKTSQLSKYRLCNKYWQTIMMAQLY